MIRPTPTFHTKDIVKTFFQSDDFIFLRLWVKLLVGVCLFIQELQDSARFCDDFFASDQNRYERTSSMPKGFRVVKTLQVAIFDIRKLKSVQTPAGFLTIMTDRDRNQTVFRHTVLSEFKISAPESSRACVLA